MIRAAILRWAHARLPDFLIGGLDAPYLRRWFVIPRNPVSNVYLHQFLRSDDDRALHDHPWQSCGIILQGGYLEHLPEGVGERRVGDVIVRTAEHRHRVVLHRDGEGRTIPAWTLFLVGSREREWSFGCPDDKTQNRFVHWRDFTAGENGELVGAGCGG